MFGLTVLFSLVCLPLSAQKTQKHTPLPLEGGDVIMKKMTIQGTLQVEKEKAPRFPVHPIGGGKSEFYVKSEEKGRVPLMVDVEQLSITPEALRGHEGSEVIVTGYRDPGIRASDSRGETSGTERPHGTITNIKRFAVSTKSPGKQLLTGAVQCSTKPVPPDTIRKDRKRILKERIETLKQRRKKRKNEVKELEKKKETCKEKRIIDSYCGFLYDGKLVRARKRLSSVESELKEKKKKLKTVKEEEEEEENNEDEREQQEGDRNPTSRNCFLRSPNGTGPAYNGFTFRLRRQGPPRGKKQIRKPIQTGNVKTVEGKFFRELTKERHYVVQVSRLFKPEPKRWTGRLAGLVRIPEKSSPVNYRLKTDRETIGLLVPKGNLNVEVPAKNVAVNGFPAHFPVRTMNVAEGESSFSVEKGAFARSVDSANEKVKEKGFLRVQNLVRPMGAKTTKRTDKVRTQVYPPTHPIPLIQLKLVGANGQTKYRLRTKNPDQYRSLEDREVRVVALHTSGSGTSKTLDVRSIKPVESKKTLSGRLQILEKRKPLPVPGPFPRKRMTTPRSTIFPKPHPSKKPSKFVLNAEGTKFFLHLTDQKRPGRFDGKRVEVIGTVYQSLKNRRVYHNVDVETIRNCGRFVPIGRPEHEIDKRHRRDRERRVPVYPILPRPPRIPCR